MSGEAIINIDKDSSHQTETETAALEKLHKTADENKISFESLIGVFESFGLVQISNSAAADDYADKLEKTMGVIDNIQSAYKACSSAVEEYNQYGYMSVDSLQALLQMDDQYLNTLELVNGKLQVNQSAYADLLATQYAEAQMEAISQAISELNAIAKGDAAEKAETFTEATEDEKNKLTALCPALKDATVGTGELAAALAAAQGAANGEDADAVQAKIDGVMNALNTRLTLIGNNMSAAMNGAAGLRNQLDGFSNSSKKAADSSNKAADSSKTLLDAWSTLTSAMKEYNEQGYITFQTLKGLTDLEDKYSSMLKKNDVTGQLEIRTDDFYKLMKAELKEAQIKGDGASEAQYNKILEWTNRNIKNQTMSYWDLVAAIEGYSAALSGAKDITDTFKDAWSNGKTVKEKQEKSRAGALDYEGTEAQSSALQDLMKYSEYDPELIGKAFNKETGKIDLSGDMLKNAVVESLKQQAAAARTEGGAAAEAIAASYEKSAENIENDVISVQDYFDGLGSTIEEVSSKIDELQSAWSDLSDVTNEYNTYGGLSVDTIYDPSSSTTTVTLEVDGAKAATLTVGRTMQTWTWKSAEIGVHTLKIVCGSVSKEIKVNIEKLGITIEPVKTNLAFDFNPAGKTNADETRLWSDGNTRLTVSDNFDWSNGGYQLDEDGDTYFCVKAGTTANISYKLFGDDAKKLGKNFKLVFKTTNVKNYDATALTCLNGGIGLNIQAQKVTLTSEQNSISLPTCEDDFMEFEFNILPDSQYKEMVLWLDGIPCRVELYDASDNFTQASPVGITIGSPDCDVLVYRMKSYMMNLTDDEILDNFIADAKNAEEMIERYTRNDITDVSGELNPDLLAEKCPDLRIIKISAPTFTTGKKNEVPNTTIQHIYKNGRAVEDNWIATGSHKGQGTSSNAYGESGRNIDINCSGGFTFGDESTGSKYAFTENSVGEKYFNIKVNVASSENANNALLADEFNEFNPYIRQARKDNPKVRDTMAFYPCVVFIQETDTTNATVFKDGQWHFYACGDFGNSKKNSDTMGMDPNNHKEVIIEIDNNTDAQARFLSGDFSEETWDGDHSFEFRYINKACTEEEVQAAKDAWIRVQNWVVNARIWRRYSDDCVGQRLGCYQRNL